MMMETKMLQVRWDEPDLLQNVKRVNPWLIELVSNIHLSPFSPPHKKIRLPHHLDPLPAFNLLLGSSYPFPFACLSDNAPAGMQGARHGQYTTTLSHLHSSKLGLFPPAARATHDHNVSCLLSMGSSEKSVNTPFVLFGQQILTEKQISMTCSTDTVSTRRTGCSSSVGNTSDGSGSVHERNDAHERSPSELSSETGHCKVFMESEEVGRTVDLSLLGSYDELQKRLASMFEVEVSEISNHVLYRDATGAVKQLGEEPFR